jgi:hypothetical protein
VSAFLDLHDGAFGKLKEFGEQRHVGGARFFLARCRAPLCAVRVRLRRADWVRRYGFAFLCERLTTHLLVVPVISSSQSVFDTLTLAVTATFVELNTVPVPPKPDDTRIYCKLTLGDQRVDIAGTFDYLGVRLLWLLDWRTKAVARMGVRPRRLGQRLREAVDEACASVASRCT